MGKLAEFLSQPNVPVPVESSIEFDDEGHHSVSKVLDTQPRNATDILEFFGHDPAEFKIDGTVRVSHREMADGSTRSTYSYKLEPLLPPLDIDSILSEVRKAKPHKAIGSDASKPWFVFQAGDLQIGKRSRDGSTEEIIEKYCESVELATDYMRGVDIAGIQISFPGDCLEGVVSQGGRNVWLTEQTVTEQTRIFRRLLLYTVQAFAPFADQVYLDVVNGNHDEAQREWNTYPGDGWATECAIAVGDALQMNPQAYQHVSVRVPEQWSGYMTVPVGDTMVTIAHGHQWRAGRAMEWWEKQAFGQHGPQASNVLQNGHFHQFMLHNNGKRTQVQGPTFDLGSDWYREHSGGGSTRGAVVYLLNHGQVSNLSLV